MKRIPAQKADWKTMPLAIEGPGRIDDSKILDPKKCMVFPYAISEGAYPVRILPHCRDFSTIVGNTVYDVKTHFSTDGRQSVFQQFRDLILSEHLA